MTDPYLIVPPALISFSGGRTSAFMLRQILDAHGGKLPAGVIVVFANTGKEREETLRFVFECETRWAVKVHWLEWRNGKPAFAEVVYNSASREGKPFASLIEKKQRLPSGLERWCTSFLKVQPIAEFVRPILGEPGQYSEAIGLRHDEGWRVLKGLANAEKTGRRMLFPLSKAKVTKADVMKFWNEQRFNLDLQPWEGNCDLCFLKGRSIRKRIIRDDPSVADWWLEQESRSGSAFNGRDRVAGLVEEVRRSPTLFDEPITDDHDVECGLLCAPDEAGLVGDPRVEGP